MKYPTDEALEKELSRIGRELLPRKEGLHRALGPTPVRSLSVISIYMNTFTKVGVALVAVIVIAGGAFYIGMPEGTDLALESNKAADTTMMAMTADSSVAQNFDVTPTEATGSVDEFALALEGETTAETMGLAAFDADVASEVTAMNELMSVDDMTYVDSI